MAVALVRAGGQADLEYPRGRGWGLDTCALHALRRVDPEVTEQILTDSEAKLVGALQAPQQHDIKGLAQFIALVDDFNEQHMDRMLANVDAIACESVWHERLADAPDEAAALLERAAKIEGPVGAAARRQLTA